ncbi:rRNA methyltransferase 3, mitochondrial [Pieris rapae]|uniref:rRNA methyltransferase 3, mitochondrial n=1 Tax=Pieris rapae TaxID=64459 RepID=UPI001E27A3A1|nr:rRNA methyltransferase 3, mitochondrial [Pieris rapae]
MSANIYGVFRTLKVSNVCISSARLYSRWVHRNPAKVILPFEHKEDVTLKKEKIIELGPTKFQTKTVNTNLNNTHEKQQKKLAKQDNSDNLNQQENTSTAQLPIKVSEDIRKKKENKLKRRNFYLNQKKVFDDNGDIIYEKLKENDSRISSLLVKLKSKKERVRTNQMLVEGWRLIVDGLEAKCKLKYVIFSQTKDLSALHPFLPNTGVEIYKISYKEIEKWSDVETPPGIFGVFELPSIENIKPKSRPLPMTFICDNIRVPGNLGAILRAAVGAGCESVLLTKGCVDLWDPKVIRSAAGAHFRQPIHTSVVWEDIPNILNPNTSIFVADSNVADSELDSDTSLMSQIPLLPYYGVEFPSLNHITLVIGGETEGISEDSYRFALEKDGMRLNIPLQKGVDSLNTGMATAVIAFEIRKQFLQAWTKIKLEKENSLKN